MNKTTFTAEIQRKSNILNEYKYIVEFINNFKDERNTHLICFTELVDLGAFRKKEIYVNVNELHHLLSPDWDVNIFSELNIIIDFLTERATTYLLRDDKIKYSIFSHLLSVYFENNTDNETKLDIILTCSVSEYIRFSFKCQPLILDDFSLRSNRTLSGTTKTKNLPKLKDLIYRKNLSEIFIKEYDSAMSELETKVTILELNDDNVAAIILDAIINDFNKIE